MINFWIKRHDIVIDLGTANTLVALESHGIVFNGASCIAVERKYGAPKVIALGMQAKAMQGKSPKKIDVVYPLLNGAISDFEMTKVFMKALIAGILGKLLFRPRIGISIPQNLTPVQRNSLYEATLLAGAKEVILIEDPFSAAVGAGIDISSSRGRMIVDIGSGLTEASIIALGGLVNTNSSKIAGDALDFAIMDYLKQRKNLSISKDTAEQIKIGIGNLEHPSANETFIGNGKDLIHGGLPVSFEISSQELHEAIMPSIEKIKQTIAEAIAMTPPQLAPDILEDGLVLTGGGALLRGLREYLSKELQIGIQLSSTPLLDVLKGASEILKTTGALHMHV